MTTEELQKALMDKQTQVLPPDTATPSDNPIEKQANPSFDEFLNMLMELRNFRFGRLGYNKLSAASASISVSFKPTRFLKIYVYITGKSASSPVVMQFNGDTNNDYLYNATGNNPSNSSINLDNVNSADNIWSVLEVENMVDQHKLILYKTMRYAGAVSGGSIIVSGVAAWGVATSQITSIQLTPSAGGGVTFGAGSFIEVIGHD